MDFTSNLTNLFRQARFRTSVKDFLEDFREQVRAEAESADSNSFEGHDYQDGDEFQCWIDGEVGDVAYSFNGRGVAFWNQGAKGDYYQPDDPDEISSCFVSGELEFYDLEGESRGKLKLWREDV